jgi:glycosyltransferase involved in cell wall biosynthesis
MGLKMIIVTPFLETRGGLERVVLKLASHFKSKIHCVRYDQEGTFGEFSKLSVEVAKPSQLSRLPLGRRVATAVEAGWYFQNLKLDDYDLINAHGTPSEWVRNRNSPVIWYCHSPNREAFDLYEWRMKRRNLLSRAVFKASIEAFKHFEFRAVPKIEYIFANSANSQKRIKKYLKRESEVLHPGVDAERFSDKGYEEFFFYPSRIAPEKELEYAIEAFRIFKGRAAGKWKLVIAGSLSTRSEHQAYYKKILGKCGDSVSIETNVSEERLLDLYSRCRAVLYTPINEDFGLVPLEAMASSKPCIARDEGGPRETIENGKDGFLVPSIFEMAGKMELLARDSDLCAAMGRSGRAKVKREFSWDRFLKRFEEKAKEVAKLS